jgi:hypothetical protein
MPALILIFGTASGLLVAGFMLVGMLFMGDDASAADGSRLIGYLTQLVALSLIFVAIKRYRDRHLGGVIKFWPAAGIGLGIALIATCFYVIAWEIAFPQIGDSFAETYLASETARLQAEFSAEEAARRIARLQSMMDSYQNWWVRIPITVTEVLPTGLIITLISAALLRNPKILPARAG